MSHVVRPGAAHRLVYILVMLVFTDVLLVGCGKRGPLYMPDKISAPPVPVEAPASTPAGSPQP